MYIRTESGDLQVVWLPCSGPYLLDSLHAVCFSCTAEFTHTHMQGILALKIIPIIIPEISNRFTVINSTSLSHYSVPISICHIFAFLFRPFCFKDPMEKGAICVYIHSQCAMCFIMIRVFVDISSNDGISWRVSSYRVHVCICMCTYMYRD